jgi:molecular chaperone DnaK (HSP70)
MTFDREIAYGIDFGTTNSVAVAATRQGTIRPLLDRETGAPHPSVVWYGPERVVVGREAKRNMYSYENQIGHRFIRSVKKQLGRGQTLEILGDRVPTWRVASEIFRHLRAQAEETRGEGIDEAVVTVPVLFDGLMRKDIRAAAGDAGIRVTTFVHEPFAAVVGHAQSRGHSFDELPSELILVFDWGGGTLDITLTRSEAGRIEELATGGLLNAAGDRFDDHLQRWAISRMMDRIQAKPGEISPKGRQRDRLVLEAERVKIRLSSVDAEAMNVASVAEMRDLEVDMDEVVRRSDFESLVRDEVLDAMAEVNRVLNDARVDATDVDRVLLIGGTSEIPLLQHEMQKLFGVRAESLRERSQTIIAEGAAIVAQRGYQPFLSRPVQVSLADGSELSVFDRETPVPVPGAQQVTFYCTDPRDGSAKLIVTEQVRADERGSVRQQEVLSVPVNPGLPKPYNHERVHATFQVDEDLVLKVQAWGASVQRVVETQVADLTFGLRLR